MMIEESETPDAGSPSDAGSDVLAARRARHADPAVIRRAEAAEAVARNLETHLAALEQRIEEIGRERERVAQQLTERESDVRSVKQREYAEQQLRVEAEERGERLQREMRAEIQELRTRLEDTERHVGELSAELSQLRERDARLTPIVRELMEVAAGLRAGFERELTALREELQQQVIWERETYVRELTAMGARMEDLRFELTRTAADLRAQLSAEPLEESLLQHTTEPQSEREAAHRREMADALVAAVDRLRARVAEVKEAEQAEEAQPETSAHIEAPPPETVQRAEPAEQDSKPDVAWTPSEQSSNPSEPAIAFKPSPFIAEVPEERPSAATPPPLERSSDEPPEQPAPVLESPAPAAPGPAAPAVWPPVGDPPAIKSPAVEEPALVEPTVVEPSAVEEPALVEPAVVEPEVVESEVVEPVVVEPSVVEEPAVEEPVERVVSEEPVVLEPSAEESSAEEPVLAAEPPVFEQEQRADGLAAPIAAADRLAPVEPEVAGLGPNGTVSAKAVSSGPVALQSRPLSVPEKRISWLAPAIRKLAAERDAKLAAELVIELIPAQRETVNGSLNYEIKIGELGTFYVTLDPGQATISREPRGSVDFSLEGPVGAFSELAAGGTSRRQAGLRIRKGRRSARRFLKTRRRPVALADLASAGVDVWPGLLLLAMGEAIDPSWTSGRRFELAFAIQDTSDVVIYVRVRDGEPVLVSRTATGQPVATISLSGHALICLLAGTQAPPEHTMLVTGDATSVDMFLQWTARAQGLTVTAS
ncbi:MAG TPA: hypothetical protein VK781_00500 [Solirubrobacteraceae bacterium]|jgi:hypothetical protein|nr:hypothetical protein [Solirubrobacteraceae bacterium]